MKDNSVIIELGEVCTIPRHVHNGYEIFYLLRGTVELDFDGEVFCMGPDDIILCNSGEVHGAAGIGPNIMFRLIFTEEYIMRETGESYCRFICNSCHHQSEGAEPNYEQLRRSLTQLMYFYYDKGELRTLEVKTTLLQILSFLFRHCLDVQPQMMVSKYDDRVQSMIQYIHQNYKENISLQVMAEQQHTSVYQLSRLFKKKTQIGFTEYVNKVRLAEAVNDLLHTNESVIRIALNNGFSNVGSLNRLFRKAYGDTPAKYRATRRVGQEQVSMYSELEQIFTGAEDIVKYLRQYDTKYQFKSGKMVSDYTNAAGEIIGHFYTPQKIIRVGRIQELLKSEIRQQLDYLRGKAKLDYIHFSCIYDDGMYPYRGVVYANYEYFQAFDYLQKYSLKPFLQINIDVSEASFESVVKRVTAFLAAARERYQSEFLLQWQFEFTCLPGSDQEMLWMGYQTLCQAVREIIPTAAIGLQIIDSGADFHNSNAGLPELMKKAEEMKLVPSFLTFYVSCANQQKNIASDDFEQYRHYCTGRVQKLRDYFERNDVPQPALILMQWDTLSGFTTAESNVFYRSALFLDEIISIRKSVSGIAYWLNTYVYEASTGRDDFDTLALFLINELKRPIYFAIILLDHLGEDLIQQEDHYIVTRNSDESLTMLIFNPCYFNPNHAQDSRYTEAFRRMFTIFVDQMQGHCIIERYHMDFRQTALYDRWANMGFPSIIDGKVMEQLNKTVNMDYTIYEDNLSDNYKLSVSLEYNEAVIIHIRKHD